MTLSRKVLFNVAVAYMALPTVLFAVFTLKPWIGLPFALIVGIACLRSCGQDDASADETPSCSIDVPKTVSVKWWMAALLLALIVVWCILAGQGGFVVQTWDWNFRNATLRDLVMNDWPVVYNDGERALAYYIGHWIPSALVGKVALALTGSTEFAWRVANYALLLWTACGVSIVLLSLLFLAGSDSSGKQFLAFLVFVFFANHSVVGKYFFKLLGFIASKDFHWRWGLFGFSPNTELLYWVFNQTVVPWIAALLVMVDRNCHRLLFVVALCLLCGPFPAIGLAFLCGIRLVVDLCASYRSGGVRKFFRYVFSFENVVGLLAVTPLVYSYLSTNSRTGTICPAWTGQECFLWRYVAFVAFTVGLYFLAIWRLRSPWWWAAAIWIAICPLVKIGAGFDFCMRASIPAFMVLMVLFMQAVKGATVLRRVFLVVVFCIGAFHPVKMVYRGICTTVKHWPGVNVEDRICSFARQGYGDDIPKVHRLDCCFHDGFANHYCIDPYRNFFYRCLANPPRKDKQM